MMKKFGYIVLLLSAALLASCGKENPDPKPDDEELGYCVQVKDQTISSKVLGHSVKYNLLLPPNYKPEGEKYNVIYLLHGMGGDNTDWLANTKLGAEMLKAVKEGLIPKTLVVMPQAWNLFYMDKDDYKKYASFFGGAGEDYETFFFTELMPQVEKQYNVDSRRECRAVAGLSMGGFGAAFYGLKHPDKFCYVYTMSQAAMEPLYSIVGAADKDALPFVFVANGEADQTVGKGPDGFYEFIKGAGLKCDFESWYGGHDWKFWGECAPKFLRKIGAEFNKNK